MAETFDNAIAIVGIGCRLPGKIGSARELWHFLYAGGDATSEVPPDRWDLSRFHDPAAEYPGTLYTRRGSFLDGFDQFDPAFFGYAPREAQMMDPQQRLLLETTWEAMEDAGLPPADWAGARVGVFVGLFTHDFEILRHRPSETVMSNPYAATGSSATIAANRISHAFDFKGPSMVIDTACSSSLVAVHQARQSLLSSEADLALAGGVNLQLVPETVISLCQARMLSPDGRCKSFDARANGYARADGVAMVALKRLSDAVAAGDPIYAVLKGSATNQDGSTPTITMPDRGAQESAIRAALAQAGLTAADISYVEAHGTGTPTGDPIEAAALGAVLGSARSKDAPCIIGSIKSNIGHTESTAGVAGLIKAALMIYHGEILPNIHFETPNPAIPFADLHLRVATTPEPWPAVPVRYAGINSFGFGGSNAHAILGEAPQVAAHTAHEGPVLLCLSARSEASLRGTALRHAEALETRSRTDLPLGALAGALAGGREHHGQRLAIAAPDRAHAIAALKAASAGTRRAGLVQGSVPRARGKLAFVCSGMGQQWWAMGRGLRQFSPVFAEKLAEIDALFARHTTEWSLTAELDASSAETSRIDRTDIAQPAIFALQVGLAAMWRQLGVVPDLIVGHSVGEVAAAHICGALTLEQAVAVSFHRSRLQALTAGTGTMMAVALPEDEVQRRIMAFAPDLCIAAVNSPRSVTLAGPKATLERLEGLFKREDIFARILNVEVPYHSPAMEAIHEDLRAALAPIRGVQGAVPMVSTVTGALLAGTDVDAHYWYSNVRQPVAFARAMASLQAEGVDTFLEIGAHPVLSSAMRECLTGPGSLLASQRRAQDDSAVFLEAAGALYCAGQRLDLSALFARPARPLFLPGYAWDHSQIWSESHNSRQQRLGLGPDGPLHPLLGAREDRAETQWRAELSPGRPAYLADHKVRDAVLFPAAGFIEMALAASARTDPGGVPEVLSELKIEKPLVMDSKQRTQVTVALTGGRLTLQGASGDEMPRRWTRHLTARTLPRTPTPMAIADLSALAARMQPMGETEVLYGELYARGLQYGPAFRNLARAWRGTGEGLGQLLASPAITADLGRYHLHPAMLDACFHLLALLPGAGTYLPSSCARIEWLATGGPEIWVHLRITSQTASRIMADIDLFGPEGAPLARLMGFAFRRLDEGSEPGTLRADAMFAQHWISAPLAPRAAPALPAPDLPQPAPCPDAALLEEVTEALLMGEADAAFARALGQAPHLGAELTAIYQLGTFPAEPLPPAFGEPLRSDAPSARAAQNAMLDALEPLMAQGALRVLHLNAGATPLLARLLAHAPASTSLHALPHPDGVTALGALRAGWPMLEVLTSFEEPQHHGAYDLLIVEDAESLAADAPQIAAALAPGGRVLLATRPADAPAWQMLLEPAPPRDWPRILAAAGLKGVTELPRPDLSRAAFVTAQAPAAVIAAARMEGAAEALVVVLGTGALESALVAELRMLGAAPVRIAQSDLLDGSLSARLATAKPGQMPVLVDLRAPVADSGAPGTRAGALCSGLGHVALALADAQAGAQATLWVVTAGAQPAGKAPVSAPDQAALWGYARTLGNEEATLNVALADLSATPQAAEVAQLARLILSPDSEDEIALRGSERLVSRVMADAPLRALDGTGTGFGLRRRRRRAPADLVAVENHALTTPAPGMVHLHLKAAGLNYKDAAITAGLLDDSTTIETGTIGLEGSGVVLAVGEGVTLCPGDEVFGFIQSIDHPATARAQLLQLKPTHLSHMEVAGVSVAMATALHALHALARLSVGDCVLIHSATSALGQASVQVARHLGARVLATAGSPAKRAWLTAQGIEVIGTSRDGTFVEGVMAATGGRGADVILSALPAALLPENLQSLRVGTGRLIDVANIHYDAQINLQAMARGVTVSAFDLGRIAELDPSYAQGLLSSMRDLLDSKALTPLPYRSVPVDGAFDVLRRSLKGAHIGRNVIDLSEGRLPLAPMPAPITLSAQGAYLVTGGVSGIGLGLAVHLAGAGARNLVLLSRRGKVSEEDAETLATLEAQGVQVDTIACDVADAGALAAVMARFGADLPPLRGVIHAAGLLADSTIRHMTEADMDAVMAPKAQGGWNLHAATTGMALEFFVTLTSVANTLGNVGQANYAAANEFLDALIHLRKEQGLPGLALSLGVVGGVGFVARDAELRANTHRILPGEIGVDEVWSLMSRALHLGQSHPIYGMIDWERAARVLRRIAMAPRFVRVAATARSRGAGDSAAAGESETPQERHARLAVQVRAEVAGVLGLAPEQLDPTSPLASQGFDSLLSVELILALERRVGVTLKQGALLRADLTVEGLIAEIEAAGGGTVAAPAPTEPEAMIDVDTLSDAEVEALLRELEREATGNG